MPISNYPHGFANGVTLRGMSVLNAHSGTVYWVDSNGSLSDNYKGSFDKPFSSIETAFNYGALTSGDIIMVKAGHTETISVAAGIDMDVAGVTVIGLGQGAKRPTITFDTAITADIDIDAANITLVNLLFVNGIDNLTAPIDVNSTDFTMINCETRDNDSNYHCDDFVVATSGATRLAVINHLHRAGGGKTGAQSAFNIDGVDDLLFENMDVEGDFAVGAIENGTDEWLRARFVNVSVNNTNATPKPAFVIDANATGWMQNVKCRVASGTTYISAVGKMQYDNNCEGFSTDGYSGEPLGTQLSTGIEGKVDTVASDVVVIMSDVKSVNSDVIVVMSDVKSVNSDVIVMMSDVKSVNSDVIVMMSDVKSVNSDVIVMMSDVKSVNSDVIVMMSDVKSVNSDVIVMMSDVKSVNSDVIVMMSDVKSVNSDVIVVMSDVKSVNSDVIVMMSDVKSVNSDVIVVMSDVKSVNSDIIIIMSDLKAFMAKYASDVP